MTDSPTPVLGLDIGGANLKAAHSCGLARSRPFALWKNPDGLSSALADLKGGLPDYRLLAVTMTGELCDCYRTKRDGVNAILDAVESISSNDSVVIWRNDGTLVSLAEARASPLQVASANWLALAQFAGRFVPNGPALLIDIGSTTTDIVPLLDGTPVARGHTDPERLHHGELIYLGVRRTPLTTLLGAAGAAEFFATTHDLLLVLGMVEEDATDCDTADGQPATTAAAHARLARMICADVETTTVEARNRLAGELLERMIAILVHGVARVAATLPVPAETIVVSGSGEFLVRKVAERWRRRARVVALKEKLGEETSTAACAYALTTLATTPRPCWRVGLGRVRDASN